MKQVAGPVSLFIALVAAAAVSILGSAAAQDGAARKPLTLIVGAPPGGGYDVYGRIVGRHLVKHLPGKPSLVVQNMVGAGSKRAAEHMSVAAPKDGSTIAVLYPGAIADALTIERAKWRYDPTKLEFLGTPDSGTRLCSTRLESKVKTFELARTEVATIGASAPGGSTFDYPTMLNALAGTKFKVVSGYKATVDIALAFDRSEVDGWCGVDYNTYMAVRPDWLAKKQVNTIVQFGLEPKPEITAMGIPSIWQFVPPENRKAMELIIGQQMFQRPFVAPPGTPTDRVTELQNAFMAAMKDKEFLDDAAKANVTIEPRSGSEVARIVTDMYTSPPQVIAQRPFGRYIAQPDNSHSV
jgi:tripartite-type tricarboxylate transporter receptor subunit TctC